VGFRHEPAHFVGGVVSGAGADSVHHQLFPQHEKGKKVTSDNPWGATTLEWQTPTPPPHGNFDKPIEVHRGPYEYSVPGHDGDFTPQTEPEKR